MTEMRNTAFQNSDVNCPIIVSSLMKKYQPNSTGFYKRKLPIKYFNDSRFSSWIDKSSRNDNKAFCKVCKCEIAGSVAQLKRHIDTEKHLKNVSKTSKEPAPETTFTQNEKPSIYTGKVITEELELSNNLKSNIPIQGQTQGFVNEMRSDAVIIGTSKVATAELKMCAFIAEHNLPVTLLEHLAGLITNACPDSKIAKCIKYSKINRAAIFSNVIGDVYFKKLISQLKNTYFSFIIDETTDSSTVKRLVILARYYDRKVQKTVDKYLTLLEVEWTALGIYSSIESFFEEHEIPFQHLIGIACDDANEMLGSKSDFQLLLKQKIPSLFIQGCVYYSMHLCASTACAELPNYLEGLVKNIHSYLCNTPKCLTEYVEFISFTDYDPLQNLHGNCMRLLSREQMVKRLLDNWPALHSFFTSAVLEDGISQYSMAFTILEALQNPITKMYFAFLAFILPDVNKLHLEFQAEGFRLHKLRKSLNTSFKGILSNFIKREVLKCSDISTICLDDHSIYLNTNEIYLGAKVESIYLDNSTRISTTEFQEFQIQTLNFYVCLANQIFQRLLTHDYFVNLEMLETLDPINLTERKPCPIVLLAMKFPNIVPEEHYEQLTKEWKDLTSQVTLPITELEPEKFWYSISEEKCEEQFRFPIISALMTNLLSLPHSSASVERLFILLNNIKKKNCFGLKTATVNALLYTKGLLQDINCAEWEPFKELRDKIKGKKWQMQEVDIEKAIF